MKPIPSEVFGQFYAPLVGDEARVDQLRQGLTDRVRTYQDFHDTDPYARLGAGLKDAIDQAARHIASEDSEADNWKGSIRVNGELGGSLTMATVRTVGDTYAAHAKVPQNRDNVAQNTNRALRHMFGIAFAGKFVGGVNLESFYLGVSPQNPLAFPLVFLMLATEIVPRRRYLSKRTFRVSENEGGQLVIRPRYQKMPKVLDR